jgi:hypothetical protein
MGIVAAQVERSPRNRAIQQTSIWLTAAGVGGKVSVAPVPFVQALCSGWQGHQLANC